MPLLPTPDTSHVDFENIYEPSEDSYLLLDTLSSPSETSFLHSRFSSGPPSPTPLLLEIGTGSGIVLSFMTTNASAIFGRSDILTLGTDVNILANKATSKTVTKNNPREKGTAAVAAGVYLDSLTADLAAPVRPASVDILIFNPPYVPTPEIPVLPLPDAAAVPSSTSEFEKSSHLLSLTYAGGPLGMATTERLLGILGTLLSAGRGVAYILLCAQNKPEEVAERLRSGEYGGVQWRVEKVGSSGKKAGWEVLGVWRVWR